jgi:hypothetical protein
VETAATIDSAGVATAIADFEGIVGICQDSTTGPCARVASWVRP